MRRPGASGVDDADRRPSHNANTITRSAPKGNATDAGNGEKRRKTRENVAPESPRFPGYFQDYRDRGGLFSIFFECFSNAAIPRPVYDRGIFAPSPISFCRYTFVYRKEMPIVIT